MKKTTTFCIEMSHAPFELSDADAFANVAEKVLGKDGYRNVQYHTASFTKGQANDKMVDEVFAVLNNPIVRLALKIARRF